MRVRLRGHPRVDPSVPEAVHDDHERFRLDGLAEQG